MEEIVPGYGGCRKIGTGGDRSVCPSRASDPV